MRAIAQTKTVLKDAFPSLWLRWHLMHRPASAEIELSFLDRIVRRDAVTVDVGANCGLYTRALAGLSRTVQSLAVSSYWSSELESHVNEFFKAAEFERKKRALGED